jgi:hypothetical protein
LANVCIGCRKIRHDPVHSHVEIPPAVCTAIRDA